MMTDPYQDNYYGMNFWQQMLGMSGNPYYPYYQAPKMQYVGMDQGQQGKQGKQQQQQSMNPNMMRQLMGSGSTATGMTPNVTNAMGESYYGWGAQTGDWGATGNGLIAGNEISPTIAYSEMGADLGYAPGMTGAAEGGGSSYLGYAAPVLAAIAAQHMLSGATDRRTMPGGKQGADIGKGHRTGDVFSGNHFTEPWMAWGEQQFGVDKPTAGERTDAAIDQFREGKGNWSDLIGSVPGTAYQWFDPGTNFFGDIISDKFGTKGKVASGILMPHTNLKWFGDWLGGLF